LLIFYEIFFNTATSAAPPDSTVSEDAGIEPSVSEDAGIEPSVSEDFGDERFMYRHC